MLGELRVLAESQGRMGAWETIITPWAKLHQIQIQFKSVQTGADAGLQSEMVAVPVKSQPAEGTGGNGMPIAAGGVDSGTSASSNGPYLTEKCAVSQSPRPRVSRDSETGTKSFTDQPTPQQPDQPPPHDTPQQAQQDSHLGVKDLVSGKLDPKPWQYQPYDRQSASWQAAAQRRHQHRRRTNALIGTASVDLSGPHEPTPMVGARVGQRPGHYFVVLVIQSEEHKIDASTQTSLDHGPSAPGRHGIVAETGTEHDQQLALEEVGENLEKMSRMPLVYADVIPTKADAAAAVQRLLARVRDDHGHMPDDIVFRLHSDKGQEFLPTALEQYCEYHGIRRTTTQGYDPSANGTGENAVGFLKRKARHLLTGSRMPSCWWGTAVLAAASYSRCAAGLESWPKIPFGTRVMVVKNPVPRNAFVPRATPGTVFGPSERVPHGMVVFQDGRLKEVVNLQISELNAEEISFVKARMDDWGTPIAPLKPPTSEDWDATKVQDLEPNGSQPRFDGQALLPSSINLDPPEEACQREEIPENPRIRIEEILENENDLVAEVGGQGESHHCSRNTPAASRAQHKKTSLMKDIAIHPHAAMTLSEASSDRNATYASSNVETTTESTEIPQSDLTDLAGSNDDEDNFIVGPAVAPLIEETTSPADKDQEEFEDDENIRNDCTPDLEPNPRRCRKKKNKLQSCPSALGCHGIEATTAATGEPDDEAEEKLFLESGARVVAEAEVRKAVGPEAARWKVAAEKELQDSFYAMGAVSETTPQELAQVGGQSGVLPMKAVWTIKADDVHKCRGCVCGNFATKDPTEQVWTAQAETSSVMSGLRLAQVRKWNIYKLDVKGAFMYAPLPDDLLVVVRPPKIWVTLGLVGPNVLWTLRKAVYGLRCAPRAWGLERDRQLRAASWTDRGNTYTLKQCLSDSQVWRIVQKGDATNRSHGLLICYVDDMLLEISSGGIQKGLVAYLKGLWRMSTEVELTPKTPMTFIGLELELDGETGDLLIHQQTFTRQLLTKYGLDKLSKPMSTIQMPLPDEKDGPPTAAELKILQGHAGEFNWLSTRTRADLAYYTSLIASAATKHGAWTLQLCKKVLRYLCGTAQQGIRFPVGGDETSLVTWSDAGYGGVGTKAQTGVLIAWAGGVVSWRSSRQSTAALSTCEAEVSAAALGFQILEGLRSLLEEWGVQIQTPLLLVDNKSALTVAEQGGTWRTRYFAVRAARLGDESRAGNLDLRHCPTLDMGADCLTKMSSAILLKNMRDCLDGSLPPIPNQTKSIHGYMDDSWWAAMVVGCLSLPKSQKKHLTSVTPGKCQNGDIAADGPAPMSEQIYWNRIIAIWESEKSKNLNRIPELKEKYKSKLYVFYEAVCAKHGVVPLPPVPAEFDEDEESEDEKPTEPMGTIAEKLAANRRSLKHTATVTGDKMRTKTVSLKPASAVGNKTESKQCSESVSSSHRLPAHGCHETVKDEPKNESKQCSESVSSSHRLPAHGRHETVKDESETDLEASDSPPQTSQPKRKRKRGKKKKLTGDQRAKRLWHALDEALEDTVKQEVKSEQQ